MRVQNRGMHECDVESQSLEKRNRILATHFLQDDSELVFGNFIDEVALELDNHVVTSKDRAESVALVAKEAESVAFHHDGVVEACLDGGLGAHNREVCHILQAFVLDFNSESEGFSLRVDISRSDLLELNFGLQLLNRFLDNWVLLIEHINDKLGCVKAEGIRSRVISTELWRYCWDTSGSHDPIRGLAWRSVAKKLVCCSDFKSIRWVTL